MNTATAAGVLSTIIFAASTLPMVVRAAGTRDVSSYSRSHLLMANAGNAVHTVYVVSLPPGPVWLLHCIHSCVSAFMLAAHVWWSPPSSRAASVGDMPRRQVAGGGEGDAPRRDPAPSDRPVPVAIQPRPQPMSGLPSRSARRRVRSRLPVTMCPRQRRWKDEASIHSRPLSPSGWGQLPRPT